MSGTPFSYLYQDIRVATGNDDPDIGTEVMPDARIDVLLQTVARTIRSYSESFPELMYQSEVVAPAVVAELTLSLASSPALPIASLHTLNAIAYAVAHKYYTGIGNHRAADETMGLLQKEAELLVGYAGSEVNDFRLDYYKRLRIQQMQGNLLNF